MLSEGAGPKTYVTKYGHTNTKPSKDKSYSQGLRLQQGRQTEEQTYFQASAGFKGITKNKDRSE